MMSAYTTEKPPEYPRSENARSTTRFGNFQSLSNPPVSVGDSLPVSLKVTRAGSKLYAKRVGALVPEVRDGVEGATFPVLCSSTEMRWWEFLATMKEIWWMSRNRPNHESVMKEGVQGFDLPEERMTMWRTFPPPKKHPHGLVSSCLPFQA